MNLSPEPDIKRFKKSNYLTQQAPTGFLGGTNTVPTNYTVRVSVSQFWLKFLSIYTQEMHTANRLLPAETKFWPR